MAENETYLCDGRNQACLEETPLDQITWFTSKLGFCPHCINRLRRTPAEVLELLRNECEANNEDCVNFVLEITE